MRGPAGSLLRLGPGRQQMSGPSRASLDRCQSLPAERVDGPAPELPSWRQEHEQGRRQRRRHILESQQVPSPGLDGRQQGRPGRRDNQHHAGRGAEQFR